MTFELACHLCNTFHAERGGCAPKVGDFSNVKTSVNTPAIDEAIEHNWLYGSISEKKLIAALKEIRALLGGKRES